MSLLFVLVFSFLSSNEDFEKCKKGDGISCNLVGDILVKEGNEDLAVKIFEMSCNDFKNINSCNKLEKLKINKEVTSFFDKNNKSIYSNLNNIIKNEKIELMLSSDFGLPFFRFNSNPDNVILDDTVNDSGFNLDALLVFYITNHFGIGFSPYFSYTTKEYPYDGDTYFAKTRKYSFTLYSVINTNEDIRNSFYFLFGFGVSYYKILIKDPFDLEDFNLLDDTSFIIPFKFGKKIKINNTISYSPNVAFELMLSPVNFNFSIYPFSFSFIF